MEAIASQMKQIQSTVSHLSLPMSKQQKRLMTDTIEKTCPYLAEYDATAAFAPPYGNAHAASAPLMATVLPPFGSTARTVAAYTSGQDASMDAAVSRIILVNKQTPTWFADHAQPVLDLVGAIVAALPLDPVMPYTMDELEKTMTSSAQRKRLEEYYDEITLVNSPELQPRHSAFTKAEVSDKSAAQTRNISNVASSSMVTMSLYTYPMTAMIKQCLPSYAFGRNNQQMADYLQSLIVPNPQANITATDFSKYDGHQNQLTYAVELLLWKRVLTPDHYARVEALMAASRSSSFTSSAGVTYDAGFTRHSGSAETSLMNTLVNIVVCIATVALDKAAASGLPTDTASLVSIIDDTFVTSCFC